MRDDWALELLGLIAKQALRDYRADYHKAGIMDARRWLIEAGIMADDGTIYHRGYGHTKHLQEVEPMAPQLNEREQAAVDAYNDMERAVRHGERHRDEQQLANFRQRAEWAQNNAEAREQLQAERKAEKEAEAAKHQARRDAAALAAQNEYKAVARATFPGTPAQFDAAWPRLLEDWLVRNTAIDMDALIEQHRQRMGSVL
jgi:hypothetical protein